MRLITEYFAKRRERIRLAQTEGKFAALDRGAEEIFVTYDMFLKGNTFDRSSGKVRQIAVTVDGATRLVTSGDIVDRATYDALVKFGAIEAIPGLDPLPLPGNEAVLEDKAV